MRIPLARVIVAVPLAVAAPFALPPHVAAAVAGVAVALAACAGLLAGHRQGAAAVEARAAAEREEARQKQEPLRAVTEGAPTAMLLLCETGRVAYANAAARELFFEGRALEGQNFLAMLGEAPAHLREAMLGKEDAVFTVSEGGEPETYRLAKRPVELGDEMGTLVLVEHWTRELHRREVDVWKKLIRVLSHELNNSLAPIASVCHSARLIVDRPEQTPRLGRVFDTIEERVRHLSAFLEGYARFARLPAPRPAQVEWGPFLAGLRDLAPFAKIGEPPARAGFFDRAQLEQALLNLLKNAAEAGGPADAVTLEVTEDGPDGAFRIVVADRGPGMREDVLRSALLPFFSTKEGGTGVGLTLCREIVEAHGGRLRLENRQEGGLAVTMWLPGQASVTAPPRARITLTRA
jgi:nitrogen fixation/metabolism regulation signal transduction histidine kinase